MAKPELPDEILVDIVRRVGKASCLHMGAFLRAGSRGLVQVYSKEVLMEANLDELCVEPPQIFSKSINPINGFIFEAGLGRCFFERCLHYENPTAVYFESLRLVTREQDLDGALAMVASLVPYYSSPTFAYAMFLLCAGKFEIADEIFKTFFVVHACERTKEIREIGEKLFEDFKGFYPPSQNTFGDKWVYLNTDTLSFPECAQWHYYRISCDDYYLFWCYFA
ncbi:putative protein [Arabidopsis thaliana]|uniref:Uncharacterized protein T18D12_20 n=2 Tax=Arabidopsis thaliana TaxID=3702 RepID=Q9M245_ARATH|nr:hypothetical protein At3g43450 [Arabidopsis thaliana]CAB81785.1 putative protein [Arabidopsis thaliana]